MDVVPDLREIKAGILDTLLGHLPGQPPVYKVLVAGDGSVGKSSLLRRQAEGHFEPSRRMTVGVDFHSQVVMLGERKVKLLLWDISGQQRFLSFRRSFYRGARAAALIFDVSDADTLHNLTVWRDEILKIAPQIRFMVVGNKTDLPRMISPLEGKAWATAMGYPYLETSALTGQGLDRLFEGLGWLAAIPR
jgi:Ras-related protein Rab-5C